MIVLASKSPRRARLLHQIGLEYIQHASNLMETWDPQSSIDENVQRLAREKATAVSENFSNALILGSDTSVMHQGTVLGKPATPSEAAEMLRTLSGSTHTVVSGVALIRTDETGSIEKSVHFSESTAVRFADLDDAEIEAYVSTGSPMDKAGAYGIQDDMGALLVKEIQGDYYNVVGLPLRSLYEQLKRHFSDQLPSVWAPARKDPS